MRCAALLAGLLAVAGCSSVEPVASRARDRRPSDASDRGPRASTSTTTTTTLPASPTFDGSVAPEEELAARLTASWRPGCPLPIEDLRLVRVDHWGYDGLEHRGELVVHRDHVLGMLHVFGVLFDERFPIERMQLVDAYGGDDHLSTRANNTAAFNCRWVVGQPGVWSNHAFGLAIDVNPLVNPYVLDPRVQDPALAPYLDRSLDVPGMVRPGDVVVQAFASIGWEWGGAWSSPDYQHFSATGS